MYSAKGSMQISTSVPISTSYCTECTITVEENSYNKDSSFYVISITGKNTDIRILLNYDAMENLANMIDEIRGK